VNADALYIDPSALRALYVHEPTSRRMIAWRHRVRGPLSVTRFGQAELANAIALACSRGDYSEAEMNRSLAHVEEDFADGDLKLVDLLWRAALDRSVALSRQYAPKLGTRARLARLAEACKLTIIQP
jgi:hypothetical protein